MFVCTDVRTRVRAYVRTPTYLGRGEQPYKQRHDDSWISYNESMRSKIAGKNNGLIPFKRNHKQK